MITKADILSGVLDITDEVTLEGTEWKPKVKALTDAQFNRAQAMLLANQQVMASDNDAGTTVNLDLAGIVENEFEARVLICSMGLNEEEWSADEARRIPIPGAIHKISDVILELGGHDLYEGLKKGVAQNVRTFRNKPGGSGDHRSAHAGSASGEQPDGDDVDPEAVSG